MVSVMFIKIASLRIQPIELRAVGQGREGITQMSHRVAVKIPLACEATPTGEDDQGHHPGSPPHTKYACIMEHYAKDYKARAAPNLRRVGEPLPQSPRSGLT